MFVSVGEQITSDSTKNRFVRMDAHTGAYLDSPDVTGRFTYIMLKLHIDMFAGLPGKLFLGFMGILFCVAVISGIVVYAPSMRKLDFGTYRGHGRASCGGSTSTIWRAFCLSCGRSWSASPA